LPNDWIVLISGKPFGLNPIEGIDEPIGTNRFAITHSADMKNT
jgi:hypothetical protein